VKSIVTCIATFFAASLSALSAAEPVAIDLAKCTGQGIPGQERTAKGLDESGLLPPGWDPALAGDIVMRRLVNTSSPQVKGAHDAAFVCVGDRAYIVAEANDLKGGESAAWPFVYATMSIVNLKELKTEQIIDFARSEQVFENETLPVGACFVPRIIQKDANTLRCYFTSEDPGKRQSQMWYRDFDLRRGEFAPTIHKARLRTAEGRFDFQPQHFHADAAAQGFTKKASDHSFFIFDSFKRFDGRLYVALNNFGGKQNALARVHEDLETFEVIGHYNEPQTEQLSESAVNRLPDGTWMAICRNDKGNYHFTTSRDGKSWTPGREMPHVPNGANSKPTFDCFGGVYYLGWQEATKFQGVHRSVFNVDISRDGLTWERKYRFETPKSFQYPTFHEHEGAIWLSVTQGDADASRKERIMFGRLETVGQFEPQSGQTRIEWPAPPPEEPAVMKRGVKLQMLANKASGPKPEVLYNGIELSLPWPPPFGDPDSAEPMPVPYLKRVPSTIPIDVGRQLFVDDFLIEKTSLKRTFHQATKFEGNPVFKAETERELGPSTRGEAGQQATVYTGHGGVFYDPAEKHFKMLYVAGWRGPLSLATSTDMKAWTRHGQILAEGLRWNGSKLVAGGSDNCVWLDLNAENPAERIKYITCWMHVKPEDRPQGFNHSLHVSDGRIWSDAVPTSIAADDYCSFFFNPFRRKWCFSIKKGTSRGRSRYYLESDEFLQGADWEQAVYWTSTDKLDAPEPPDRYPGAGDAPQLYSLNAVAYESLMVGMHYIHRGPKNDVCDKGKFPKLVDLELGFSRDGFHWHRPDRRGFIVGSRTEGSWDRAYLHSTAGVFVVFEDQLVFPYTGFSGLAPSGHRGMYTGGSIGLAMLRRDGFASMDGPGELTTRPVKFNGEHLFVNLNGELRVEVLDRDGRALTASEPVSGDETKQRVELAGLAELAGKPVKFRFHVAEGSLYAFWVTPDENGASQGYVGAGGPAFGGIRDGATPE
jgi:hypothetical protein